MPKKRVAIIGTTGLPAKYGGFETLTHHLVDRLNKRFDITVYCSSKYVAAEKDRPVTFNGAKLEYLPLNANGYQSILYDMISMIKSIRNSDVLLVLGISGAFLFPFLKLFTRKPILVNIDGQEWKRPKWSWIARKYLSLSEEMAVRYADTVITDNLIIREYVEDGYRRSDAWLIEYGADHVQHKAVEPESLVKYPFLNRSYAFNVCRIEPENQVHMILEAYAKIPNETIVVVGLWNHSLYGKNLKEKYSHFPNIFLLDPVYDQDELDILRSNAKLYIHGHSAGGTNPSLVEAMYLGLPVLAFDISYNRETTSHRAIYWRTADELRERIRKLTNYRKKKISADLSEIAQKRYTWGRITDLYARAIEGESYRVVDELTMDLSIKMEHEIKLTVEHRLRKVA
jgi:glycosyltransferase involved in cell wall biosynthesis